MSFLLLASVLFLAPQPAPDQLDPESVIAAIDHDGDARIDWEEARNYALRRFHVLDTNGDGVLQAAEFPQGSDRIGAAGELSLEAFQATALQRFNSVDGNADGELSADEIRAWRARQAN